MFHAAAPPCPEYFFQHHIYITMDGKWFSIYPPGQATVLALALRFGLASFVEPACFALASASLGWMAHIFFRPWTARRLTLLFIACPLNWLLGASYMSHLTFLATFSVGLAFFTAQIVRFGSTLKGHVSDIIAGFCMAFAGLIRPQDFIIVSAMAGLTVLIVRPTCIPSLLGKAVWLLPGVVLPAVYQLLWNHHQYGSALALGYARGVSSVTPLLRPYFGFSPTFGPRDAAAITGWSLLRLNKCLLGWPSAFLLLPWVFWPGRIRRRNVAALLATGLLIGFYFFYFYYGAEYEARFYHPAVPLLLYLAVRGFDRITSILALVVRRIRHLEAGATARAIWVTLCAAAWLYCAAYYLPVYLWPKYSHDYEQASPVLHRLAEDAGLKRALVLVPSRDGGDFRYSSGFMWNDPRLAAPVIYARGLPGAPARLAAAFPKRTIYRFEPSPDWQGGRFDLIRQPAAR